MPSNIAGLASTPLSVTLHGENCNVPPQLLDVDTVQCITPANMFVGTGPFIVSVAGQISAPVMYKSVCIPGFYGRARLHEHCVECPSGAGCAGDDADPVTSPGYYQESRKNFTASVPLEASLGVTGSPCAVGYRNLRCAKCDMGFYRLGLVCEPCPSFTFIYIVLFLVVVRAGISFAYWLNRKRASLVRFDSFSARLLSVH